MKCKYKIKIFFKKNKLLTNKIINGVYINNNIKHNIYILKNIFYKKILKNNFISIYYNKIIEFVNIENINFTFTSNDIEHFIIKKICNICNVNYICLKKKINEKLFLKIKTKLPRNIYFLCYKQKKYKNLNFNFINLTFNKVI